MSFERNTIKPEHYTFSNFSGDNATDYTEWMRKCLFKRCEIKTEGVGNMTLVPDATCVKET